MSRLLAIIGLLLLASVARAEPVISLPLDGYYRPGKFFPVRITADQPVDVRIDSSDGVSARGKGSSLTLPVMVLSPTERSIRVTIDGRSSDLPIRSLGAADILRLTTDARRVGSSPTSEGQTLSILLPADQLAGVDQSYESADQLFIDHADLPRLSDAARRTLLAGGVEIATDEAESLSTGWPWVKSAESYVIDLHTRGPKVSSDDPLAAEAVADFEPARSLMLRRSLFLGLALFSILLLASTLIGRRAIFATCGVSVLGLIGIILIAAGQSPITERSIAIFTEGGFMDQRDEWFFRTSASTVTDQYISPGDMVRPIFTSQAKDMAMWVEPSGAGWRYSYTLKPRHSVAFVSRQFIPLMRSNQAAWNFGWRTSEPTNYHGLIRTYYRRGDEAIEVPASKSQNPPSDFLVRVPLKSN